MKKRKGLFSKVLVSLIVTLAIAFTVAVLMIFRDTGAEPAALVAAVFGVMFGELWALAIIKKEKERKGDGEVEGKEEKENNP